MVTDHYYRQQIQTDPELVAHIDGSSVDPFEHVVHQIQHAIAELVAAFRDVSFRMGEVTTQNGYAFYGADFAIDRDLNVWLLEGQAGVATRGAPKIYGDNTRAMMPYVFKIVEEVQRKQSQGQPILPLEETGKWELIYTDEERFQYDFPRTKTKAGCPLSSSSSSSSSSVAVST